MFDYFTINRAVTDEIRWEPFRPYNEYAFGVDSGAAIDGDLTFPRALCRSRNNIQRGFAPCSTLLSHAYVELDCEIFFEVKRAGLVNEQLVKIGVDAPISIFVGIGQCAARGLATKNRLVKLLFESPKAALDIPQAFAESQLRAQRPCIEIDYRKKKNACGSCPDTESRIGEMNAAEENPSVERKRFALGTFSVLPSAGNGNGRITN